MQSQITVFFMQLNVHLFCLPYRIYKVVENVPKLLLCCLI